MTRIIYARFTTAGWHNWPGATGKRTYLAASHRHLFHVEVSITVEHDDREVEFHDLQDVARAALPDGVDWGACSCEHLAHRVAAHVRAIYPNRAIAVDIAEDGECGARLSWSTSEVVE